MMLWTGFMLGLVGSLHCAGMCGPLAMAVPVAGSGRGAVIRSRLA
jgi:sulfite exporter TauE/SafE